MTGCLDIALAIFNLGAAGGLERHAVRLGATLVARGHRVTFYTTGAGKLPCDIEVHLLRRRGITNHARLRSFAEDMIKIAAPRHAMIVGFQKMPGLDVLFCADWCFVDRSRNTFERMLPRYRTMAGLEAAVCGLSSATRLLMLAEPQAEAYRSAYAIPAGRIMVLPPTLDHARVTALPPPETRSAYRAQFGIGKDDLAWLWVGLQPRVKGLDRAIRALALAPGARLIASGARADARAMRAAVALARDLGCADRITATGSVSDEDLGRLLVAADVLVHPARLDVTGTVILEALGAGLPVVVTENCGYAPHVRDAGAGEVVRRGATPEDLATAASPSAAQRQAWSMAARDYVRRTDLTKGLDVAASIIEQVATKSA